MKKVLSFLLFIFVYVNGFSQDISFNTLIDGYWGSWKTYSEVPLYGSYSQLLIYNGHPSNFSWRMTINDYYQPTKQQIKEHNKTNTWFEYKGVIEYYISDEYPDARSQLLDEGMLCVCPWNHDTSKGQTPCVKRTSNCIIKIAPYKDHPRCYSIYFENVGFGIDLGNGHF